MNSSITYISDKLRNASNVVINPATEEKQDDIITALSNISIDADSVNLNTDGLETLQTAANASLSSIDTKLDAITTPSDTQPISATALPLPTGASTEAKQDSQIVLATLLETFTESLYEVTERLAFLASVRGTAADLRVTPLSTPNMATLTTLSNQTSMGGFIATQQIPSLVNTNAYLNNITNITVS